jgi:cation diffusion facilitator family transporter
MKHPTDPRINKAAKSVTWLGVGINIFLSVGKIGAGLLFASQAVLADGVHSLSDLISDIAVLFGLRYGDRPADPSHPYGHRRLHTLMALFVGLILVSVAFAIGYQAIMSFHHTPEPIQGPWPLVMAAVTIPLKEFLYHLTVRIGRKIDNTAVVANAWHHRSDAFTSLAATAGIAGAMFLGPQWRILDALTALVLAAFLIVLAGQIVLTSGAELIDRAPKAEQIARLSEIVLKTRGVRSYHAVRARKLSGMLEMDVHVQVDPQLSVREGHHIATNVRRRIRAAEPKVQEVIVHVEPDESENAAESG